MLGCSEDDTSLNYGRLKLSQSHRPPFSVGLKGQRWLARRRYACEHSTTEDLMAPQSLDTTQCGNISESGHVRSIMPSCILPS